MTFSGGPLDLERFTMPPLDLNRPLRWNLKPVRLLCSDSTARPGYPCVGLAKWPDGVDTLLEFSLDGTQVYVEGEWYTVPVTNALPSYRLVPSGEIRVPQLGEFYRDAGMRVVMRSYRPGPEAAAIYPIYILEPVAE